MRINIAILPITPGAAYVFKFAGTPLRITSSSPPNLFVDPLQDRDPSDSNTLYGIQSVSITFSAAVKDSTSGSATLTANNFQVRCTKNGADVTDLQTGLTPSISTVTGTGPYTVHLSRRICLGAWTEIRVKSNVLDAASGTPIATNDYDNRVVLGFLPMDVNQDYQVSGDDIIRWVSITSETFTPPPPFAAPYVEYLDQKRNGIIAGEDINSL